MLTARAPPLQRGRNSVTPPSECPTYLFKAPLPLRSYFLSAHCPFFLPRLLKEKNESMGAQIDRCADRACHIKLYTHSFSYNLMQTLSLTHTEPLYKTKENLLEGLADALWSFSTLWSLIQQHPSIALTHWTNTLPLGGLTIGPALTTGAGNTSNYVRWFVCAWSKASLQKASVTSWVSMGTIQASDAWIVRSCSASYMYD